MNGMIALRTVSLFLVTSLISAIIGLVLVILVHPGNTETKETLGAGQTEERKIDIVDNFLDLGRNLFPDNIFKASFMTVIICIYIYRERERKTCTWQVLLLVFCDHDPRVNMCPHG